MVSSHVSSKDTPSTALRQQYANDIVSPDWICAEYQQLMQLEWCQAKSSFEQFTTCLAVTEQAKCEILSAVLVVSLTLLLPFPNDSLLVVVS